MTDREQRVVMHVDRDPVEQYGKQVLAEIEEERALALAAIPPTAKACGLPGGDSVSHLQSHK